MEKRKYKFRPRKDLIKLQEIKKTNPSYLLSFDEKEKTDFTLANLIKGKSKILNNEKAFYENQKVLNSILKQDAIQKKKEKQMMFHNLPTSYQMDFLRAYITELRPILFQRLHLAKYKKLDFILKYYKENPKQNLKMKEYVEGVDSLSCMLLINILKLFIKSSGKKELLTSQTFTAGVNAIRNVIKYNFIFLENRWRQKQESVNGLYNKIREEFETRLSQDIKVSRLYHTFCIDILEILCGRPGDKTVQVVNPLLRTFNDFVNKKEHKYIMLVNLSLLKDRNLINYAEIFDYPLIYPHGYNYFVENQGGLLMGNSRDDKIPENNMLTFHQDPCTEDFPALRVLTNLHNVGYRVNLHALNFILTNYNKLQQLEITVPSFSSLDFQEKYPESGNSYWDKLVLKQEQARIVEWFTLSTALYFAKYNCIYFNMSLDRRGRVYPLASFLSIQGGDLSKALLQFSVAKTITFGSAAFNDWVLTGLHLLSKKDLIKYKDNQQNLYILKTTFLPIFHDEKKLLLLLETLPKNKFQVISFYFDFCSYINALSKKRKSFSSRFLASLDATSSSFQIISCLSKDTKMAEACNILNKTEKPRDVYLELLDKTIEKYINIPFDKKEKIRKTKFNEKGKIIGTEFLQITLKEWEALQNLCNDEDFKINKLRPSIKHFAMSYGPYNMSVPTGYSYIQLKLGKLMVGNILRYFRSVFYLVLKEECKNQKLFSKFLAGLIKKKYAQKEKEKEPFHINISSFFSVQILYNFVTSINVLYNLPYKRQIRVTLKPFIKPNANTLTTDVRTSMTTFPPNFVHHLDSLILFHLAQAIFKKNPKLCLGTNHDCFYTHVGNFSKLRKEYKKALTDVLKDPTQILNQICIDNNLDKRQVLLELQNLYVDQNFMLELNKSKHAISF